MRSSLVVLLMGVGCGNPELRPSGKTSVPPLADQDPAAGIAEFQVTAGETRAELLDGRATAMWAYRDGSRPDATGTVPGPLLEVKQGEHVVVHFRNELPEATTVHWHGLRVPNASDGTPAAQAAVAPEATFDYEFDAADAGFFWFHPHVRSDVQIERGLYAPLIVRANDEPEVTEERVLVLDDVKIESNGELSSATDALDIMLGRQGNVLLVNGVRRPRYQARPGGRERWRLVNAANGRYFNLSLPGHSLRVIGWDGGRIPRSYLTEALLVAPGERYDVLVDIQGSPGEVVPLQTTHYDRGHDIPDQGPLELFELELGATVETPLPTFDDGASSYEPIPVDESTPTEHLVLSESEEGEEPSFFINQERFPASTPLVGEPGAVAIWQIENDAEMDHPFHLHGMFFQVLDVDGVAPESQGFKDTLNIERKRTARIAIRYGSAGRWMYHCHILEHAERGMMGELMLE